MICCHFTCIAVVISRISYFSLVLQKMFEKWGVIGSPGMFTLSFHVLFVVVSRNAYLAYPRIPPGHRSESNNRS